MASNHVQQSDSNLQNGSIFDGPDAFNYNNLYNQGQTFPNNLQPTQHQSPHLNGTPSHSPFNDATTFDTPSTSWQNAPAHSSIGNAQQNPYWRQNPGFYGGQSTNNFYPNPIPQWNQNVDPTLLAQSNNRTYAQSPAFASAASQTPGTIAPSSLQQNASQQRSKASSPTVSMPNVFSMQTISSNPPQRMVPSPVVNGATSSPIPKAPKGSVSGNFVIVSFDDMAKATNSKRLAKFVNIASAPIELNLTKVNIPQYVPRKSQNELKALAASDPSLSAKIMKRVKKTDKSHKRPVGRLPKNAAAAGSSVSLSSETSSSESDSDSDYDSDSDASQPPEKSPLPSVRPQKAVDVVRYDTIKAVWFPRNKFVENERIIKGLQDFWEVVRTIRDRWKSDREAVKKALETKQMSELPLLRERVDKQLEMMEAALKAAADFGHPDLLNACGQNSALMSTCYAFILEPVREAQYSGTFVKSMFKFLSLCSNLNSEISEKTGLSKLFIRSIKRGNDEIKAFTAKINENIAATDRRSKVARSLDKSVKKGADSPKSVKSDPSAVAGVKRERSLDGSYGQPAKRVASSAVASASKEPATAAKLGLVKKTSTTTASAPASTAAKPKIVKPPTSTAGFLGLQSASKKPGTSNADQVKKSGAGAAGDKKATPARPAATAKPAFSFAETMANLAKEKEVEKKPVTKKDDEQRPPETEEEKSRRLRKESRRHLRVSWKADNTLVEVRTFSPDPSELSGKARNVRDVGNGKEKEGFTLKKHMDQMDIDEEDDGQPMEQTIFEYREPSPIDFSTVHEDMRANNYERFGGYRKVDSAEKAVQDNHEANTLMVHYLAKADIPPTPREPTDPYSGVPLETKSFGYPDDTSPWLLDRLKRNPPPIPNPIANIDISALLQSFGGPPQAPPPTQAPPAPTVPDLSAIEGIIANLKPQIPTQEIATQQNVPWPPAPPPQLAPADATSAAQPTTDLQSILAQLTGGNAQPAVPPAPAAPTMMQQPPIPPAPPQLGQAPAFDAQAFLAQLVQNNQQQTQATAPPVAMANSHLGYSGTDGHAQAQPDFSAYYQYMNAGANNSNNNNQQGQKRKWTGNESKKFTHPCRFWKEGKCKKGDACTFRHDP